MDVWGWLFDALFGSASPRTPRHKPGGSPHTRGTERGSPSLSIAASRESSTETVEDFPLPPVPERALPLNYPGSQGFLYEARVVHAALKAEKLEPDEWTHEESVTTQKLVDAMRADVIKTATGD